MEHKNPWKTLSKETIYDNNWITVEHHKVLNAADKPGIYGKVHFKNTAIGIIPVDDNNNTWLVGQHRYPLNKYSWEIPEGGGALDVPPLNSAKRELKEETGIVAKDWSVIQHIHTSNSVSDEFGLIYLAENLTFKEAEPEETEELIIKKIPLKKALQMVVDNEITDSLSVAGILKLSHLKPHLFD